MLRLCMNTRVRVFKGLQIGYREHMKSVQSTDDKTRQGTVFGTTDTTEGRFGS